LTVGNLTCGQVPSGQVASGHEGFYCQVTSGPVAEF
jgi:hypothetical protein